MFQLALLKWIGKGGVDHHPDIDEEDLLKLYKSEVFDINNPIGLQRKVFFEILLYICRRGRENLRKLTKHHFSIDVDSQGRRYIRQTVDEQLKNHKTDNGKYGGVIYECRGDPNDPVSAYEKYVSKLHPESDLLFQKPILEFHVQSVWYGPTPLSHNAIGNMMSDISAAAGTSKRYTNHCIRGTCVTVLDENFDARHIMSVSLHKSEASIRSYSRSTSMAKKRKMAETISSKCGLSDNSEQRNITPHIEESAQSVSHEAPDQPYLMANNSEVQVMTENAAINPGLPLNNNRDAEFQMGFDNLLEGVDFETEIFEGQVPAGVHN